MFLDPPSFHWYQVCEFWFNTLQVAFVPSWLHCHVWARGETCINQALHTLHFHHAYHFELSPNGLNQAFFMHTHVPIFGKKKKYASMQTCWLSSPSRAKIFMLSPPLFYWPKCIKHAIITTQKDNLWPHSHFCINSQTYPSTVSFTLASTAPYYICPI